MHPCQLSTRRAQRSPGEGNRRGPCCGDARQYWRPGYCWELRRIYGWWYSRYGYFYGFPIFFLSLLPLSSLISTSSLFLSLFPSAQFSRLLHIGFPSVVYPCVRFVQATECGQEEDEEGCEGGIDDQALSPTRPSSDVATLPHHVMVQGRGTINALAPSLFQQ